MAKFRNILDPMFFPSPFGSPFSELDEERGKLRDDVFKTMSDQVLQSMAKQFGMPKPLVTADCIKSYGVAADTITPNPALPLEPADLMERVNDYCGLSSDVRLNPCKWMTKSETRKRPSTNRRQLWRKWHATKTVQVPDPAIYCIGNQWCGHPETLRKLITALRALDKAK